MTGKAKETVKKSPEKIIAVKKPTEKKNHNKGQYKKKFTKKRERMWYKVGPYNISRSMYERVRRADDYVDDFEKAFKTLDAK